MTDLLDDATRDKAADALVGYNAMETTKRRHFDYLNMLESKRKKFNLEATEEEKDLLASLLQDHDHAVKNFKQLAQSLQSAAPDCHVSLFKYIGLLNEVFADSEAASGSRH